jgi:hypothetical protein
MLFVGAMGYMTVPKGRSPMGRNRVGGTSISPISSST